MRKKRGVRGGSFRKKKRGGWYKAVLSKQNTRLGERAKRGESNKPAVNVKSEGNYFQSTCLIVVKSPENQKYKAIKSCRC